MILAASITTTKEVVEVFYVYFGKNGPNFVVGKIFQKNENPPAIYSYFSYAICDEDLLDLVGSFQSMREYSGLKFKKKMPQRLISMFF